MTLDKDRKRIIRNRMKTTGESYTTARRHVLARGAGRAARPAASDGRVLPANVEKLAGKSNVVMKARTGRDWPDWVRLLDAAGAASMSHGEIARLVYEKHAVSGWWSQTVAVGYERLTGRREVGQRISGEFEASKSKTFAVSVTTLFDAFADERTRRRWLNDVDARVRSATAPKMMRLHWPDGTVVVLWFTAKGEGKSNVSIAHTKLASRDALENAKNDWAHRLEALGRVLTDSGAQPNTRTRRITRKPRPALAVQTE